METSECLFFALFPVRSPHILKQPKLSLLLTIAPKYISRTQLLL